MAVTLRITGGEELRALEQRLRAAGRRMPRELTLVALRATRPMKKAVKDDLSEFLPDAYAAELEGSVQILTQSRTGRVTLLAHARTPRGAARDLASLNRGRLRHPLFENREFWYDQAVRPRWWTNPLTKSAREAREEIVKTLRVIARRIEG